MWMYANCDKIKLFWTIGVKCDKNKNIHYTNWNKIGKIVQTATKYKVMVMTSTNALL